MNESPIHTPGDGRGLRDVLLDGKPIKHVVYADTEKGKVRVAWYPYRINKRRQMIRHYTMRGHVEVIPRNRALWVRSTA